MNRTMRSRSREKKVSTSPGMSEKKGGKKLTTLEQIGTLSSISSRSGIYQISNPRLNSSPVCAPSINHLRAQPLFFNNLTRQLKNSTNLNYSVSLANIKNLSLASSLFILIKVLNLHINFCSSGRRFHFALSSCYITPDQKLIIQSDKCGGNQNQLDEANLVQKVINGIAKICGDSKFQDFQKFFKRARSKFRCNFRYTVSLIKSYCLCSKIELKDVIQYAVEPKESSNLTKLTFRFGSLRISRSTNPRTKNLEEAVKFLKYNKSQEKSIQKRSRNPSGEICPKKKVLHSTKTLIKSNQTTKMINTQELSKCAKVTKQSQASTDFKTSTFQSSLKGECVQSFTFHGKLPSPLSSFIPFSSKTASKDKQGDLPEVQSMQESSENEKQKSKLQNSQTELCPYSAKLFEDNNWVKKCNNLFEGSNKVMESFIQGKQEQMNQFRVNPENLGRLARVVVESQMPPGAFDKKNSFGEK